MNFKKDKLDQLLHRHLDASTETPYRMSEAVRERILDAVVSSADPVEPGASRKWNPFLAVAAAAVVVLAVLFGLQFRKTAIDAHALVELGDGKLLETGRRIQAGETARTGDAGALLTLADGSRVEMRAHSELALERAADGVLIRLSEGSVIINAAKQHGHLYVQTKDSTVSVVGTVFLVNEEAEGSRIAVIEGEVHVRHGAAEKSLMPGEQVMTKPQMVWQPVSEEITWSRRAEEHLALLQQSAPLNSQSKPRPAFEVASVKLIDPASGILGHQGHQLNRERYVDRTELLQFIVRAYLGGGSGSCVMTATPAMGQTCPQIAGMLPEWAKKDRYEIQAKMPANSVPAYTNRQTHTLDTPEVNLMLQVLLEDRFHLKAHREMREIPVYALTVAKNGPKLKKAPPDGQQHKTPDGFEIHGLQGIETIPTQDGIQRTRMDFLGSSMKATAEAFGIFFDRPVIDRTDIKGEYDFTIEYDVDPSVRIPKNPFSGLTPSALSVALQAIGLKLESTKAPVEVLVIDRVEKPSEN